MKKFDEFINEDREAKYLKKYDKMLQPVSKYLMDLTGFSVEYSGSEKESMFVLYGQFTNPFFWEKDPIEYLKKGKEHLEQIEKVKGLADKFDAKLSFTDNKGGNRVPFEIHFPIEKIEDGMKDDLIRSLMGIDKYNL